ncbi:MAG: bifunctional 2-C-methyl-D-erythritol 4-phosphate cytidylyltransferase/2-C-methyl-D-erythritol 2,4-cyclodiphosphate synthase [Pseudomonadota bacterium]
MSDHISPIATQNDGCAIILAAGSGTRARGHDGAGETAKQFVELGGKPLLAWSLITLSSHKDIATVVLVLPPSEKDAEFWNSYITEGTGFIAVSGGASRRESTFAGLEAWASSDAYQASTPVLVHDGARPFPSHGLVDRLLSGLEKASGAIPCLPITDTLKKHDGDWLSNGPDRTAVASVQTPQAFRSGVLLDAHRSINQVQPREAFTDDASIVEWAGHQCLAVDGEIDNIKITTPKDWDRAAAIIGSKDTHMLEPRTGLGYDVHRLVPGDGVWLCGHFIAHTHKLDGHSDADVGLHALTDALLGTIAEGDIGTHFPPSDPTWKGAASHLFVRHAANMIRKGGGKIINIDIALVAENPKIGPHREAMVAVMAEALGISPKRVSVKATTNERMGFAGREEGIAAFATASVMVPSND